MKKGFITVSIMTNSKIMAKTMHKVKLNIEINTFKIYSYIYRIDEFIYITAYA